jgi:hypothetical protein
MTDADASALPVQIDATTLDLAGHVAWMTDAGPFNVLAGLEAGDEALVVATVDGRTPMPCRDALRPDDHVEQLTGQRSTAQRWRQLARSAQRGRSLRLPVRCSDRIPGSPPKGSGASPTAVPLAPRFAKLAMV